MSRHRRPVYFDQLQDGSILGTAEDGAEVRVLRGSSRARGCLTLATRAGGRTEVVTVAVRIVVRGDLPKKDLQMLLLSALSLLQLRQCVAVRHTESSPGHACLPHLDRAH